MQHQPVLPLDRLILTDAPAEEALEMDVLIVGAGPAGLACAIELARLAKEDSALADLGIAVLEKAGSLGEHSLSGAVVNPRVFRELFPDVALEDLPFRQPVPAEAVYLLTEQRAQRIPTPPTMHNKGYYTASLCEIVRWLGERAEAAGVNIFAGFPVDALLVIGDAVRLLRVQLHAGQLVRHDPLDERRHAAVLALVVERHRVTDSELPDCLPHVRRNALECELGRVDADHNQALVAVFFGPGADIGERSQPVDAAVCPEVDEDDLSAQR
jgi:ribulose 1,5-bisphosphate synthetase/thiazole synthase